MIEKATIADIPAIFPLIKVIWEDMAYPLLEVWDAATFKQEMTQLMKTEGFKFSYQNAWVYRQEGQLAAVLYAYPGQKEPGYDAFLKSYMAQHHPDIDQALLDFDRESTDQEYYLDSLVVSEQRRGQGIGGAFLKSLPDFIPTSLPYGLNCDLQNPKAKLLYERLGFETVSRVDFLGHAYDHMLWDGKEKI